MRPSPRHFVLLVLIALAPAAPVRAEEPRDKPPEKGGYTYSLGLPSRWKPWAGFEMINHRPGDQGKLGGYVSLGMNRDLGNPIVGAAALGLEAYGGYVGQNWDGGGRAMFTIPSLLLGAGADYNIEEDQFDLLLRLDVTVRRGGIFGGGSTLALRYLPTRGHTFGLGVSKPLWGRHLGRSRAREDHVVLDDRKPARLSRADAGLDATTDSLLTGLAEAVSWVVRFNQPFAEVRGADAAAAMEPFIGPLRDRLSTGPGAEAEIRAYHRLLERTFAAALARGDEPTQLQLEAGVIAARVAREALLEEVLLPYDRLLGQYKKNDSLYGLIAVAQTRFGRRLLDARRLAAEDSYRLWFVFQSLCDALEEERRGLKERWEDPRFVWLPLQLALQPGDHDTQAEIDALIEKATRQEFTEENRLWYVVNESFQWEMARSVRLARDYHVLWIHDYRGVNGEGEPDILALDHTINYLDAMAERIREYDQTGVFPTYMILIDQHFYEINAGKRFLRLLEKPLTRSLELPAGYEEDEARLEAARQRLLEAVSSSRLLALERSQYGERWFENYLKVHVSVTNQADPSFYSLTVAGIVPVPDNNMRDHRKIAFYDVSEEDPYRGLAMFTGMGIGEHYAGANWEDRAIMIQGPGALAAKDAARHLLQTQGFEPDQIPWALRPKPLGADYASQLAAEHEEHTPEWTDTTGSAMQLHSETGFFAKPVEVAKAVQYSLMPAGSVLQVPDSLWQNYLYASLLAGSALRGCRVLVISPALEHAPAGGSSNMARAHDLMARMIVFEDALDEFIEPAGGLLAIGLYAPRQDVGDIAGRYRQALQNRPPWLARVFPTKGREDRFLAAMDSLLEEVGYVDRLAGMTPEEARPKLHLKANFFASRSGWEKLLARPEIYDIALGHIGYLARQSMVESSATAEDLPDVRTAPEELQQAWLQTIERMLADCTPEERERILYYFTVGSVNLDYRSMVLNAETMVIVSGWQSLSGLMDFILLPGLCQWVDTIEELDALLPAPGWPRRWVSNFLRILL